MNNVNIAVSEGEGTIVSVVTPSSVLGDTVFTIAVTFRNIGYDDYIRLRIIDVAIEAVLTHKVSFMANGEEKTVAVDYLMPYNRDVYLTIEVSHMVGGI